MKIGIFDSGIGGLTVLHQALITLPKEDYIYYADTDNVPYGIKTKNEIVYYVDKAVKFLVEQEVKAIVIACNTATSVAIEHLRDKFTLPILGMEPAVKVAMDNYNGKRVMIIATPLTLKEDKLRNLLRIIQADQKADLLPLPKLVSFAEAGKFETIEVINYLKEEFSTYNLENYSTLVLGCTHFNYFKDILTNIFPAGVQFIDGSQGTVNHLKNILLQNNALENNNSNIEYYLSGRKVIQYETLTYFNQLLTRLDRMLHY